MSTPIETRVSNLEAQMEATQAILNQTVILQQQHVQAIAQIDERLDRIAQNQEQHIESIGRIDERLDRMTQNQEQHIEAIGQIDERLDQMTQNQQQNMEAIAQLTAKQSHNENLFTEVLRVMGNLGSRSKQNEVGVESLHDAVGRLTRAADTDRQETRAVTGRLDSMVSRLDVLVNHLISRDGQSEA